MVLTYLLTLEIGFLNTEQLPKIVDFSEQSGQKPHLLDLIIHFPNENGYLEVSSNAGTPI
jgi:hypothetical protein